MFTTKTLNTLKISNYSDIMLDYQDQFLIILMNLKNIKGSNCRVIEDMLRAQVIKVFKHLERVMITGIFRIVKA